MLIRLIETDEIRDVVPSVAVELLNAGLANPVDEKRERAMLKRAQETATAEDGRGE